MTNMTLAIPEDLHTLMRKHKEIRWSEVARQAIWEKAKMIEQIETIAAKSKLTQKDADEIAKKIKKGMTKRHGL